MATVEVVGVELGRAVAEALDVGVEAQEVFHADLVLLLEVDADIAWVHEEERVAVVWEPGHDGCGRGNA